MGDKKNQPLLLALILPSYIVVPKRVVVNKPFQSSSAILSNTSVSTLSFYKEMDIGNNSTIRGHTTLLSKVSSQSVFMSSSTFSTLYHKYINLNNININSSKKDKDKSLHLSQVDIPNNSTLADKGANSSSLTGDIHGSNKATAFFLPPLQSDNESDKVSNTSQHISIRVNLPYDINQAINSDS